MTEAYLRKKLEDIRQRQRVMQSTHAIERRAVETRQKKIMELLFEDETRVLEQLKALDWYCRSCARKNVAAHDACFFCSHKRNV